MDISIVLNVNLKVTPFCFPPKLNNFPLGEKKPFNPFKYLKANPLDVSVWDITEHNCRIYNTIHIEQQIQNGDFSTVLFCMDLAKKTITV